MRRWSASVRPRTWPASSPWRVGSGPAESSPTVMSDLAGKVAVVTGASRGMGRAIARELAAAGATVVAAARGDHAAGTVAAIVEAGGQGEAAGVDVTDTVSLEKLPSDVVARHGRLDILVSNAGI